MNDISNLFDDSNQISSDSIQERLVKFFINDKLILGIITGLVDIPDLISLFKKDKDFIDLKNRYYPEWNKIKFDKTIKDSIFFKV